MDRTRIGVVGAGQMGSGIAQVAAQSGLEVVLYDLSDEILARGLANIDSSLQRLQRKERLSDADGASARARIHPTVEFTDLAGVDFVIEAATENEEIKIDLFRRMNELCRPEVVLASNTSSISITRLGSRSSRPEKVIGMHFMNPPQVMKLVEIVRGLATTDDTYETVRELAERMGKVTMVAEDSPGFVVNRVLLPMINEAVYCVYEGVGSVEDVDKAMKLGSNQPMGPLALADLIGLDTCLAIMEVMQDVLGDDKYRPCPLLKKYVDAGYLGRKSGHGFYRYGES